MLKHDLERKVINVAISDLRFSRKGELLKTTLGSCVSVVLYANPKKSDSMVCSMSHYLLPTPSHVNDKERLPFRFGDVIIEYQINKMLKSGLKVEDLYAKLAGGATMFPLKKKEQIYDIGNANVEIAKKILKTHRITITGENTGYTQGRSILFDPETKKLRVHIFGDNTEEVI
ncbi:MAG: chemotaxis protein CheD [Spirochaetia bacterium]|nr:chemotaxis protein CheD [Spirochaetia bacterium]